jgi:hypothetical protein
VSITVLGIWLLLHRRSHHRTAAVYNTEDTAFYVRFVRLVERYAFLRPASGQTAREYGERIRIFLQSKSTLDSFVALPQRLIELFYRVRFGGQPLSEQERATLNAELNRFAAALSVSE